MITVYFGSPGAGKTTCAVALLKKQRRYYDFTFANFDVSDKVARTVQLAGLGAWTFPQHSYIAIDEAGIEYNNRKFKSLPQQTIEWFKLHRHYKCDISVWSQSWEDMDITLRRLATDLWYVKKLGPFTLLRRVYKRVAVDPQTHQIIDGYRFTHVLTMLIPFWGTWKLVFRPRYYRYFDSYKTPATFVRFAENPIPHLTMRTAVRDLFSVAPSAVPRLIIEKLMLAWVRFLKFFPVSSLRRK